LDSQAAFSVKSLGKTIMDLTPRVNSDPRRALPSVDQLSQEVMSHDGRIPRWAATEAARRVVAQARLALADGGAAKIAESQRGADWVAKAQHIATGLIEPHPRRVINATGVVLHTNLGRSPIAPGAARAAAEAAAGYSNLELELASGRRGDRLGALETKLRLLSGAEAAYACNNNAAAVLLMLNTLAAGRQVVVSRGELVEIGGSFRVPEIMRRAGVELVEVGSTNRTHAGDYTDAIGPETALLLKVHRSNFEQRGFVKEVGLPELVEIGRARGVPVAEDLGSGTLVDLQARGFPAESQAAARLAMGPDVVCFSGDKLMGGPQAGIALGAQEVIAAMRSNPLARALRLDKMTLAAMDWTLARMLDGSAEQELPVLRQLLMPIDEIDARSRAFADRLAMRTADLPGPVAIEVLSDRVPVGGGSLPGFELDSRVIAIETNVAVAALAAALRRSNTPVLARVRDDALLVDLRTVAEDELDDLERSIVEALH
jgi:L-seryl-tRNA(Ser) seleniumtransferase